MKKTITVSLSFGKYRHCLWNARTRNFIKDQPERFVLLEGKKCETGSMYFCETYLEAQFVMALEEGVGLYFDECADRHDDASYVVCTRTVIDDLPVIHRHPYNSNHPGRL